MKQIRVCLFILVLMVSSGFAAEKTVRITDSQWVPYYGQFLPNYGIVPQIVKSVYNRSGYHVSFDFMAWTRALKEVKEGNYDAVATASYTEERAKDYLYTMSFMDSPIVFYQRKESNIEWKTLEDLKPYKIGITRGYSYSPEFDNAGFLQKVVSRSEVLSFKKLYLKQAHLIVMDNFVGQYTIDNRLNYLERDSVKAVYPPLYIDKLHLMFSKNIPDAQKKINAFNEGLKKMIEDGSLNEILSRHGYNKG